MVCACIWYGRRKCEYQKYNIHQQWPMHGSEHEDQADSMRSIIAISNMLSLHLRKWMMEMIIHKFHVRQYFLRSRSCSMDPSILTLFIAGHSGSIMQIYGRARPVMWWAYTNSKPNWWVEHQRWRSNIWRQPRTTIRSMIPCCCCRPCPFVMMTRRHNGAVAAAVSWMMAASHKHIQHQPMHQNRTSHRANLWVQI